MLAAAIDTLRDGFENANAETRRRSWLRNIPILSPRLVQQYLRKRFGNRAVTLQKARNFLQAHKDKLDRAVEVQSLPWILNLDTFNGCNLECPFCPTGTGQMERKKARMPVERAKRVIDAVKDHVLEVRLFNWGEPLLNPDIFEVIRYAHDAGLYTTIDSNLSIKVADLGRKLVDSKLDRLQASVDGLTQESLEIYRRKADSELIFKNVRAIVDEKTRRGVQHPWIDLAFLVFRHNEHQLDQLESKRLELGADSFHPRRACIYDESLVPENPDFPPMRELFAGACDFLYEELTVEADGAVSPCCTNMSSDWDVGALDDIGELREFWNNPQFQAMRARGSGGGSRLPTLCDHCDLVRHPNMRPGPLSPEPPSFQAAGIRYDHGFDSAARQPPRRG